MREIKFRAWDKEAKVLSVVRSWDFAHGDVELGKELQPKADKFSEEIEVTQYTGLKDKNGKEIYEGDILETESGICEVKWYGKGACFRWMFTGNSESPLNYDDIEVIGNIYEHGELLK